MLVMYRERSVTSRIYVLDKNKIRSLIAQELYRHHCALEYDSINEEEMKWKKKEYILIFNTLHY